MARDVITPHQVNVRWHTWNDALEAAEDRIGIACTDSPENPAPELVQALSELRASLHTIRMSRDRQHLEAMAADRADPRRLWAQDALSLLR